jgi:hypothetical protein
MFFKNNAVVKVNYEHMELSKCHVTDHPYLDSASAKAKQRLFAVYRNIALEDYCLDRNQRYGYEIKTSVILPEVTDEFGIKFCRQVFTLQRPSTHPIYRKGVPRLDDEEMDNARASAKELWAFLLE